MPSCPSEAGAGRSRESSGEVGSSGLLGRPASYRGLTLGPEPRLRGSRSGDVIWTRIVRGGLARIELRRIPPGWARTARAGVDSGGKT